MSLLLCFQLPPTTVMRAFVFFKVNCHRDVINCLLDNGANVNKLNDEGLSVLAACHVLFYTKHTWKNNIAETIPDENLFNCIQEDKQKGIYIHRNYRQNVVLEDSRLEKNLNDSDDAEENSEDECVENIQNENCNQDETNNSKMPYKVIEFNDRIVADTDSDSAELENNLNNSLQSKLDFNRSGFKKSSDNEGKLIIQPGGNNMLNSGILTSVSDISLIHEETDPKTGKSGVLDPSLFSIMSAMTSTRQPSDSGDDLHSEKSMEQNKQILLAMQR